MLKFKHIKILESLLLESDLIIIGNEAVDIINMAKGNAEEDDIKAKIDDFLTKLIENDILNKAKADPQVLQQLSQVFLNVEWTKLLTRYTDFISQLIEVETEALDKMVEAGEDTELQLARIKAYKGRLGIIWKAYHSIESSNWTKEVNELLEKIKVSFETQKEKETEVSTKLVDGVKAKMEVAKPESDDFRKAVSDSVQIAQILYDFTGKDQAEQAATSDQAQGSTTSKKETTDSPIEDIEFEEVKEGEPSVQTDKYKERIAKLEELIKDLTDSTKKFNRDSGGQAATMCERDVVIRNAIEELRNWKEAATLESQFAKVRIVIMTDDKARLDLNTGATIRGVKLNDEAKRSYIALATDAYLEAKSRLGEYKTELQIERYKGVTYSPNINLPLFTRTAVPITSKQQAESSRIQYLSNALKFISSLLPSFEHPGEEQKALGQAALRLRKAVLPQIGRAASKIARKVGGKDAQISTEKWTRILFSSEDSGLDQPKSKIKNAMPGGPGTKVKESDGGGVAPGVSLQTPGTISGMGNPVAPTQSTTGSGDNFQPHTKGRGKNIKSFDHFIKGLLKK